MTTRTPLRCAPLTTLQSHLELMMEGIWEADFERLQGLHEETIRLGKMVGDLGKIAQMESENLVLNTVEVDINKIIPRQLKSNIINRRE